MIGDNRSKAPTVAGGPIQAADTNTAKVTEIVLPTEETIERLWGHNWSASEELPPLPTAVPSYTKGHPSEFVDMTECDFPWPWWPPAPSMPYLGEAE